MRRAAATAAGLLLALALGVAWRLAGNPGAMSEQSVASAPAASTAGAPASAPSSPQRAVGLVRARGDAASSELSARAERMRADWCGYGAAEHERETDAMLKRIEVTNGMVGQAVLAELNATDGARVLTQAREQVRQRWVQALRQQSDLRSLALAEYLGPGDDAPAEEIDASRRQLQALARSASDPMLTALALMRPCSSRGCVNVEASQWSRLEPQNLQAWLVLLKGASDRTLPLDYVIERMASQGQFTNAYDGEVMRRLLSLPQATAPGLQAEAEMQFLAGVAASWSIGNFAPISRACREPSPPTGRLERCETIAEVFWRGNDLISRGLALGLVRATLQTRPAMRSAWERRASEFEAVRAWTELEAQRWAVTVEAQPATSACALQALAGGIQRARWHEGEWAHAVRSMQDAGGDPATLAAQWRQQAGRGVLDPMPSASAPSR